jgi:hypothetical protein
VSQTMKDLGPTHLKIIVKQVNKFICDRDD